MTDPYARTPQGLFDRILQRIGSLEARLARIPTPPPAFVLPDRLGETGSQTTDWNTATVDGFYWGNAAANQPAGAAKWVGITQVGDTGNTITQLAVRPDSPALPMQIRVRTGGVWGAWATLNPPAPPTQGTTAQRDAIYPPPGSTAQQAALANQKISWFNTDLGWAESYYAPAGTAGLTAPGLVAGTAAGWYPSGYGPFARIVAAGSQAHTNGSFFTNWRPFGTGSSARNSTVFSISSEKLVTSMAGRYRARLRMDYPSGSGTAVIEFGKKNGAGAKGESWQTGIPLLSAYGQVFPAELGVIVMEAGASLYYQTVTASWSIGSTDLSFMSLEYVGPLLVSV